MYTWIDKFEIQIALWFFYNTLAKFYLFNTEEGGSPSAKKSLNVKTGGGGGFSSVSPGSPSKTKFDKDNK